MTKIPYKISIHMVASLTGFIPKKMEDWIR